MDEKKAEKDALGGAHTAKKEKKSTPSGSATALEDQFAALIGSSSGPQEELFEVADEIGEFTLVEATRNRLTEPKGPGRPKGAQNKANGQMRDALLKMGFNHPMLNLATLANTEPQELARLIETTKANAMRLIMKANMELLPYFESKMPAKLDVDVNKTQRHLMLVGDMRVSSGDADEAINVFSGQIAGKDESE